MVDGSNEVMEDEMIDYLRSDFEHYLLLFLWQFGSMTAPLLQQEDVAQLFLESKTINNVCVYL